MTRFNDSAYYVWNPDSKFYMWSGEYLQLGQL